MKKLLISTLAGLALTGSPAYAGGFGGDVAGGLIGGIAGGMIAGAISAQMQPHVVYVPVPVGQRRHVVHVPPRPVVKAAPKPIAKPDRGPDAILQYTHTEVTLPDGKHPVWVYYVIKGQPTMRVEMPSLNMCAVDPASGDSELLKADRAETVPAAQRADAMQIWKAAFDRFLAGIGDSHPCSVPADGDNVPTAKVDLGEVAAAPDSAPDDTPAIPATVADFNQLYDFYKKAINGENPVSQCNNGVCEQNWASDLNGGNDRVMVAEDTAKDNAVTRHLCFAHPKLNDDRRCYYDDGLVSDESFNAKDKTWTDTGTVAKTFNERGVPLVPAAPPAAPSAKDGMQG